MLGFYAPDCAFGSLSFEHGGSLVCRGGPLDPVVFAWYNTFQEQSSTNWSGFGGVEMLGYSGSYMSLVDCSFTRFFRLAGDAFVIGLGDCGWSGEFRFRDCEFYAPRALNLGASYDLTVRLTNCLFQRGVMSACVGPLSVTARNNLFYGGDISFENYGETASDISLCFTDSLFYSNNITFGTTNLILTNGYNGYMTNCDLLTNGTSLGGDVILTNFQFQTGALGPFYYSTDLPLIDAASYTNAGDAGFFWYTTTANNVPEGTNRLDIGYHYIALTNGAPIDTDGDGIPSYLEDSNGNGVVDSGETDWQSATDPGLRVWISDPKNNSNLP